MIFDLDTEGQAAVTEEAHANPILPEQIEPSFFEGVGSGSRQGVMRGGARAAEFLGMAAIAPVALYDRFTGQDGDHTDAMFRVLDDTVHSAVDYWTPRPEELGTAGRILGGLSEIVLPLMAGGGNPALMIGAQEMGTAADLVRQGVDASAAVGVGVIQGAAASVGFKMPFLGRTLASRMLSGAVGNLAVNALGGAASAATLKATGHETQAEQFNPANIEARTVDILTGLAFGGLAHVSLRPSERAAILTATDAKHFQVDTAPGEPANLAASVAHQEAMDAAVHDLLRGEPVVAPEKVSQADFIPRPEAPREVPPELKGYVTPPDLETTAELPMPEFTQTFTTAKGSTYRVEADGTTTRDKAARPEHPGESGPQPRSQTTFYVDDAGVTKLGEFQAIGAKRAIAKLGDGRYGVRYLEGPDQGKVESRTATAVKTAPEVGLIPVELWSDGTKVHFGNKITEISGQPADAEPVHIAVSAARQRLAASDLNIATGEFAADGTPASVSARELMAQADENVTRAKTDAKAFEAAVACHMQGGG